MPHLRSVTALACLIVFAACDSPTLPTAAPPEVALAGAEAPKSTGAPINDQQIIDFTRVFPCLTYDMEQQIDARINSKTWLNSDGSFRSMAHIQGQITFTNLTTGDWARNDVSFNEEVLVSADGLIRTIRDSGLILKVRREARGRQIAYEMGRAVLSLDFSTTPPTVLVSSQSGRSDGGLGPCVDLGDPAP